MLAPKDWREAIALNGRHPAWLLAGPLTMLIFGLLTLNTHPKPWPYVAMPIVIFILCVGIWWVSPASRRMSVFTIMLPAGLSLVAGLVLMAYPVDQSNGFSTATVFLGSIFSQMMAAHNSPEALARRSG